MTQHTLIAFFDDHAQVESSIRTLHQAGFNMNQFSIVGKECQSPEFIHWKESAISGAKEVGRVGAVVGGLVGFLTGAAIFSIPGVGPILIAGPIVGLIAGEVGGAFSGGIAGALVGKLKFSQHNAVFCEKAINAGKFALLFLGTPQQEEQAKQILSDAGFDLNKPVECSA